MARSDILVIGAGIIGVTSALALQRDGHSVRILDRKGVAAETSRGNAGAFAYTDIEPLATPGILRKAPKWLLDPLGPLSIPPAYALPLLPWMLRFWRASWQDRYAAAVAAQASLMHHSRAALERLIANVDGEPLMRREGQLQVYEGEAAYRTSLPAWDLRRQHGVRFDLLQSPSALAEIQPGLSPRFTHAGYTPDWMNTVDPARWTEYLAQQFVSAGGTIEIADIRALRQVGDGVEIETATGTIRADQVVLAAGAWSHYLARTLGDSIPLETERGYNTTLPASAFDLKRQLVFSRHGFVVTPLEGAIRVGGAVELAGLEAPPDYRRADAMLEKTKGFLPGLDASGGRQWMGYRPSLPDSLPVISRASRHANIVYAFGHGHLGLTQAAATARLVRELVANEPPSLDLAPFSAKRF
jgi:D-amino-acid dehydrogenase